MSSHPESVLPRLLRVPACTHSRVPSDVLLELPNGNALLELLDHVPARVVRLAAMWMRDGDDDARVSELEHAEAMLDDDVARAKLDRRLAHDVRHLALGHRSIRGVLHAVHWPPVVHVAHGADEQHRRAVRVASDLGRECGRVDGSVDDRGSHQPPATGGMIATSSPASSTRLPRA